MKSILDVRGQLAISIRGRNIIIVYRDKQCKSRAVKYQATRLLNLEGTRK